MAFDFNPDLIPEDDKPTVKVTKTKEDDISRNEAALVSYNTGTSDVVTINNLLGLTQSHIQDDNECREVVKT